MRTTKLFIDNGNGYQEVDLYDNLDIPITYNVADVQDISKKDSNFSLTVKLPNTNNNAQIFDVIHEIARYNSTFEMLKQYPAFVEVENNRTFEGYFRLTKVVINDDREISYEGNLYSNVIEFMKRLGTTTLRGNVDVNDDLSFSDYTMTLDAQTWFDRTSPLTYGKDCYFAPVDKYNLDSRNWLIEMPSTEIRNVPCLPMYYDELTPFLYYKEIWDRIFKWAGFSYVSDFIQDTVDNTTTFEFEKLVYPATTDITGTTNDIWSTINQVSVNTTLSDLLDTHIYGKLMGGPWTGNVPANVTSVVSPAITDQWSQCGINESNPGQTVFSSSTPYRFTFPQSGVYSLNMELPIRIAFYLTDNYGNILTGLPSIVNAETSAFYQYSISLIFHQTSSNTDYVVANLDSGLRPYESSYNRGSGWNGSMVIYEDIWNTNRNIYAEANDYLYFQIGCSLTESDGTHFTFYDPNHTAMRWAHRLHFELKRTVDPTYLPKQLIDVRLISDFAFGGTFDPTVILNPKRKKVDFISDIIKKFNLYIEDVTDKKDENGHYYRDTNYYPIGDNMRVGEPILRIEPRPLYYKNEHIVRDWTSRTDVGTIEFSRIDDYLYNILSFNDKNDKTYFVEDYNSHNYTEGEYGEEIITSPFNTSDDNTTEVKTELGQTMCGLLKRYDDVNHNQWLQCPFIFKLNNDGSVKDDVEYNDRMLFVFDLQRTDATFQDIWEDGHKYFALYNHNNALGSIDWSNPNGRSFIASYCLLDHFNIPFGNDTADLNFGWANWYYQNLNGRWATSNNCYNVFYKDMVDEYNSPDSRMMTCKMYLKPSDICDLKLSDTIIVNNVAYHINKIKQWKNGNTPTQVELIKVLESHSLSSMTPKENRPPQLPAIFQPAELITDLNEVQQDLSKFGDMIQQNSGDIAKNMELVKAMDEMLKKLEERVKKLEAMNTESPEAGKSNTYSGEFRKTLTPEEKERLNPYKDLKTYDQRCEEFKKQSKQSTTEYVVLSYNPKTNKALVVPKP